MEQTAAHMLRIAIIVIVIPLIAAGIRKAFPKAAKKDKEVDQFTAMTIIIVAFIVMFAGLWAIL